MGALFLLSQLGAHAARLFGEQLAKRGLKPYHAGILRLVDHNPGISQQTLSGTLGVFASRMVLLLDELEKQGLLERRPSPGDRRSHRLHLTRAGQKAAGDVERLTRALEESVFAPLSKRDAAHLEDLLRRVVDGRALTPGVHPAYGDLGKPKKEARAKQAKRTKGAS